MKIYTPNNYSYIKVVEIPKVELKTKTDSFRFLFSNKRETRYYN